MVRSMLWYQSENDTYSLHVADAMKHPEWMMSRALSKKMSLPSPIEREMIATLVNADRKGMTTAEHKMMGFRKKPYGTFQGRWELRDAIKSYSRGMEERYRDDSQRPELDPDIWVAAFGAPKKGRAYGFGHSLGTTRVISSCLSSVPHATSPFTTPVAPGGSSSAARP
ncbi:hypothetical protein Taro_043161 [Colocasia esculenta]|uniref:Uncharacterized protein n=1 Tax=Colocasia esculenta TaxID=4460 RepID=A0A843WFQ1_COLES|nr:hypothetical protein [Colocasia esculenta]